MGMNILIVDDSKETRREIVQTLRKDKSHESILEAGNGLEALRLLAANPVDLILTDLIMPEMDGFKLIETIRKEARLRDIPIILLTVRSNLEDRVRGLEIGAWDFLVKPVHPVELNARVRAMLRLKELQDKLKARVHQLERLAIVDELTGLYNKRYLIEFLRREMNRSKRFKLLMTCVMIDLDGFKKINDTHGHLSGDRVLKEVGVILGDLIRRYDFAARYGGDEFTLILPQQKNKDGAMELAERLRSTVENHSFGKDEAGQSVHMTVSVGFATYKPEDDDNFEALLGRADQALYQAKSQGRNRIAVG